MNEKIASFEMTMNHLFLVRISCHEKYHRPGWLKQHTFIPHCSGTREVKVRLLADLFPGQSFVSGSQTSTIHYVLMWQLEKVLVFIHLMRKNPHLHDLIQTEPPSRAPSPNPPHWELELQHMNWVHNTHLKSYHFVSKDTLTYSGKHRSIHTLNGGSPFRGTYRLIDALRFQSSLSLSPSLSSLEMDDVVY